MPWSSPSVSEIRTALVHAVRSANRPVADAARDFGVSRKTAYKWLARFDAGLPLIDHSRRPDASPRRTAIDLEDAVLEVRDRFGWGPRKIHAYLRNLERPTPPIRTIAAILRRKARVGVDEPESPAVLRFERPEPNQLWQLDFKGCIWVGRAKVFPFTVLDDHSRYLLAARPGLDQTMRTAWDVLWDLFGDVGLPDSILCDNAFGTHDPGIPTISWFEAQLLRLGIRPRHGRPYHPQTQGKIERLHGTLTREVWPHVRRDTLAHFASDLEAWRVGVYNSVRPHEALDDRAPVTRWTPCRRRRPQELPSVVYPPGADLRKVSSTGDVSWRSCKLLVGRGLVGEWVQVTEADTEVTLSYAEHEIRRIPLANFRRGVMI
jgi:transposase InsO family protein